MTMLKPNPFDVKLFSAFNDGKLKSLSCEKSTLCGALRDRRDHLLFQQLYDDACDTGIAIRNRKTGNITVWYCTSEDGIRDAGDEVTHWEYKPTPETLRKFPRLAGWVVNVWND